MSTAALARRCEGMAHLTARSCDRRWTGTSQAHCMACHEHFSTVRNFDLHRPARPAKDGSPRCGKPAELTRTKKDGTVVPLLKAVQMEHGVTWVGFTEDTRFGEDEDQ